MESDLLIKKINDYTIIDVRSPEEYRKGHIPTAINVPLFSDEERKIIGTIYKSDGKQKAIEKGLTFVNMPQLINEVKSMQKPFVVYCARGGMRSSSVTWLLKLLDYEVLTLKGGYKFFRRWVIGQFKKKFNLRIIGGFTGVGKTEIIQQINNSIDLEALANHRGSVFGSFEKKQPTQEQFENLLAISLFAKNSEPLFVEDESRFIGNISIPNDFYIQMKKAPIIILKDLLANRLSRCIFQYKNHDIESLKKGIKKIEKKLGSEAAQKASLLIDEKNYEKCCSILFSYYDKTYSFALSSRDPKTISYLEKSDKSNEEIAILLKAISQD